MGLGVFAFREPQKPAPGSFEACFGGLGGTGFNQGAADLINNISGKEGTSRDLLAVTMMNENAFQLNPKPNYNGYTGDYTTDKQTKRGQA